MKGVTSPSMTGFSITTSTIMTATGCWSMTSAEVTADPTQATKMVTAPVPGAGQPAKDRRMEVKCQCLFATPVRRPFTLTVASGQTREAGGVAREVPAYATGVFRRYIRKTQLQRTPHRLRPAHEEKEQGGTSAQDLSPLALLAANIGMANISKVDDPVSSATRS